MRKSITVLFLTATLLAGCAVPFEHVEDDAKNAFELSAGSNPSEALQAFAQVLQTVEEMGRADPGNASANLMLAAVLYRLYATDAFALFPQLTAEQKEQARNIEYLLESASSPAGLLALAAGKVRNAKADLQSIAPHVSSWTESSCLLAMAEFARLIAGTPDDQLGKYGSPRVPPEFAAGAVRDILRCASANFALAAWERAGASESPEEQSDTQRAAKKLLAAVLADAPAPGDSSADTRAAADGADARPRIESLADLRKLAPALVAAFADTNSFSLPPVAPCGAFLRLDSEAHQARGRASLDLAVSEMLAQRDEQVRRCFGASLEHFVFAAFLASEVSPAEKQMIGDFIRAVVDNLHSLREAME